MKTLDEMNIVNYMRKQGKDVDIINSWRLNERHYGVLTGLPKANIGKLFGEERVTQWRRSWDVAPPPLHREDHMDLTAAINAQPTTVIRSKNRNLVAVEKNVQAPNTESLKDCAHRVLPLWNYGIAPRVLRGETVLVVAHANSIRSLLKCIEGSSITDATLRNINIPSAIPLIYDFAAAEGEHNVAVDEIPDLQHANTHEDLLQFSNKSSVYYSKLRPLGIPSKLGVRGRYIANKALVDLDLGISAKTGESDFANLLGKSFYDIVRFSDSGAGKEDALVITDGKGQIVHSNDAWSTLCGFSRSDVLGRTNAILQGPLTSKDDINRMNEKLLTGLPTKANVINYRKNGNAFNNEIKIIPIFDNNQMRKSQEEIKTKAQLKESLSIPELTEATVKPSFFIAKLEKTPDRLDLPALTSEEIKQRDAKFSISHEKEIVKKDPASIVHHHGNISRSRRSNVSRTSPAPNSSEMLMQE